MQSHEPGYAAALAACKHFGKKWDELTEQERKWKKPAGKKKDKTPAPASVRALKVAHSIKTPPENRDDLYFLADALKMVADEMRALNDSLRDLIAEAKRETSG